MRTHREMPWLWRSLVSIACVLPASACVDAVVGEVDVCEYEGKSYGLNDKFTAKDGCNTCKCTIEGEVECTELACGPQTGCDEKEGCYDAGQPSTPTSCTHEGTTYKPGESFRDEKNCSSCVCRMDGVAHCEHAGCGDAGPATQTACTHEGRTYKLGESFHDEENCSRCVCQADGVNHCEKLTCYEPDAAVAPGTCEYAFKTYKPGDWFVASDNCNKCECTESGVVACTVGGCNDDAGVNDGGYSDAGVGSDKGTCLVGDKLYRVGEGFARDSCNKCTCVSEGFIECTSNSCAPPPGCTLGNELFPYGKSVTCDDGCNTCTCQMDSKFSRTERACSALQTIAKCDAASGALHLPAALIYQTGDVLAVSESRCVNGQTNVFSLCYDDLASTMGNEATVFVTAGTGTRTCSGTERVYSLLPLRDDYRATFPGRTGGKIILRGSGEDLLYQFGM